MISPVPLAVSSKADHGSASLIFMFFIFVVVFVPPTDPKTLKCFLVSFSSRELGHFPRPGLLSARLLECCLTVLQKRQPFNVCVRSLVQDSTFANL